MYYLKSYKISDFQNSSFPISLKAFKVLGNPNAIIYSYLLGIFIVNYKKETIDKDGFFPVNKRQMKKNLQLAEKDINDAITRFKELELCVEKNEEEFKLKLTHPLYEISGLSTDYFNAAFFTKVNPTIIEWVTEHKDYLLKNQTNISLLITLLDEYSKSCSKKEYERLTKKILDFDNLNGLLSLVNLRAAFKNFINDTSIFAILLNSIEYR